MSAPPGASLREGLARLAPRSLRYKLLVLVFFPILLVVPAALAVAVNWSRGFSHEQLLNHLNTSLNVAQDAFRQLQRGYLQSLRNLADSHAFQTALAARDSTTLERQIAAWRATSGFDFLHLTDLSGAKPGAPGSEPRRSPLIDRAARGLASVGVELLGPGELRREGSGLAARVAVALLDTRGESPVVRGREERALVVRAVHPVRDLHGAPVALLDGGVLLNGNFQFVDAMRDVVYGPGTLPADSHGSVSLILEDVRVSTNLPLADGRRALGTLVAGPVRDEVFVREETWVGREFVVGGWYVAGYVPLLDPLGHRVGMLGTAFLEAPFREAYYRTIAVLLVILGTGLALAAALAVVGARSIFGPVEAMLRVVRATQAGDDARIGPLASRDELGELARQLDEMLGLLQRRNEQIREAAEKLESKVQDRTRELNEKNLRLQATVHMLRETRQQLVSAEKLAALGELTAGVAHEINNPAAVIQGNLEVIREELGPSIEPVRTEVGLIFDQVDRIRTIVDKLLRFSRPSEYRGQIEVVPVDVLVRETLSLVRHEFESRRVTVEHEPGDAGTIAIDRQELQQVLVNLLLNAVQASPAGGVVKVLTHDRGADGVAIGIRDHGPGIPVEHMPRVFDPFFTTRRGSGGVAGTGLGLSVSLGIVRRYGGDIACGTAEGGGALFEVYLPRAAPGSGGEVDAGDAAGLSA